MRVVWMAACLAALMGCANTPPPNTVQLTVVSAPAGAYITEQNGGKGGIAPQVYNYPLAQFTKDQAGCIHVKGFDARWGSGAVASSNPAVRLCPAEGRQFHIALNRNPADAGLDRDLDFALKLERQQSGRESAGAEAAAAGFAGAMGAMAAGQQRQPAMRCTSRQTFFGVETDCN